MDAWQWHVSHRMKSCALMQIRGGCAHWVRLECIDVVCREKPIKMEGI